MAENKINIFSKLEKAPTCEVTKTCLIEKISSEAHLCPEKIEKWDRFVQGFRYPTTSEMTIFTSETKGNLIKGVTVEILELYCEVQFGILIN